MSVPESQTVAGQVAPENVLMYPLQLNVLHPPQISASVDKTYFIQNFTQIVTECVHAGS